MYLLVVLRVGGHFEVTKELMRISQFVVHMGGVVLALSTEKQGWCKKRPDFRSSM